MEIETTLSLSSLEDFDLSKEEMTQSMESTLLDPENTAIVSDSNVSSSSGVKPNSAAVTSSVSAPVGLELAGSVRASVSAPAGLELSGSALVSVSASTGLEVAGSANGGIPQGGPPPSLVVPLDDNNPVCYANLENWIGMEKLTSRENRWRVFSNQDIEIGINKTMSIDTGVLLHLQHGVYIGTENHNPKLQVLTGVLEHNDFGNLWIVAGNNTKEPVKICKGEPIGIIQFNRITLPTPTHVQYNVLKHYIGELIRRGQSTRFVDYPEIEDDTPPGLESDGVEELLRQTDPPLVDLTQVKEPDTTQPEPNPNGTTATKRTPTTDGYPNTESTTSDSPIAKRTKPEESPESI